MKKKCTFLQIMSGIMAAAAALVFSAGSLQGATFPFSTNFGTDNDGDGGFSFFESGSDTISVASDGLLYDSASDGSWTTLHAAQEFTNVRDNDFTIECESESISWGYEGDQIGATLFTNGNSDDWLLHDVQVQYFPRTDFDGSGDGKLQLWNRDAGDQAEFSTADLTHTEGEVTKWNIIGEYDGSDNLELTATLTDHLGESVSGSLTTAASDLPSGDWFGLGARTAGASSQREFLNYSIVPEPSTLMLLGLAGLLLMKRRL